MTTTTLTIKDGNGTTKNLAVEDNGSAGLSPYHLEDTTQRAALISALGTLGTSANQNTTNTTIAAMSAKLPTTLGAKTAASSLAVTMSTDGVYYTMQTAAQTSLNTISASLAAPLKNVIVDSAGAARQLGPVSATGTATATGGTASITVRGDFNVSFWGTFSATIQVERSFDNGTTWLPLTALGTVVTFTTPASEIFSEPETGVKYRLNVTQFTSGTINFRISQ